MSYGPVIAKPFPFESASKVKIIVMDFSQKLVWQTKISESVLLILDRVFGLAATNHSVAWQNIFPGHKIHRDL